jgi:hypothetical protein
VVDDHRAYYGHLIGDWALTGMMGDVPLEQQVRAEWVLSGIYVRMHCLSTTTGENPTVGYEAIYHLGYNASHALYVMLLLDTTEIPVSCVVGLGRRSGDSLPFLFEYGETRFYNTFTWHPGEDRWSFLQTSDTGGTIKAFATKGMTRLGS